MRVCRRDSGRGDLKAGHAGRGSAEAWAPGQAPVLRLSHSTRAPRGVLQAFPSSHTLYPQSMVFDLKR